MKKTITIAIILVLGVFFVSIIGYNGGFDDTTGMTSKDYSDIEAIAKAKGMTVEEYKELLAKEKTYDKRGKSKACWVLAKIVYFALAAFIFSLIFWGTFKWLVETKKRRK